MELFTVFLTLWLMSIMAIHQNNTEMSSYRFVIVLGMLIYCVMMLVGFSMSKDILAIAVYSDTIVSGIVYVQKSSSTKVKIDDYVAP